MSYPPLDFVSPQRERELRRQWRYEYKARGNKYPRLHTIALVELDKITVPEWAYAKRIPGLTETNKSVWLRRILARRLALEDEEAGGTPKLTFEYWLPCKICRRQLLGLDAIHRYNLNRKYDGWRIPCDLDCPEIERARLESRWQRKPKGNGKAKHNGTART